MKQDNEVGILNAYIGNQGLENRKDHKHINNQIKNIYDSLAQLRMDFENLDDTLNDEGQSYAEDESHVSHNEKGSDDENDNRRRVHSVSSGPRAWSPDDEIPKCQLPTCRYNAYKDGTGYSIACSNTCFKYLTGNPPKNRSTRTTKSSHHQSWDDEDSKSAGKSHHGWDDSAQSSTYTSIRDDVSALDERSCGQSILQGRHPQPNTHIP